MNYRRSAYNPDRNLFIGGGLVVLLLILGFVFYMVSYYQEDTMTCTVSDKDRTTNSSGSSDARIYTEDCGTLQVSDAWLKGHFSSSDTYASIDKGKRYEFTTIGWRVPFFSMFPNIIEAEEVK